MDALTIADGPSNRREDPDVRQAFMIGAVACPNCKQVHIDFVDAENRIFASGQLSFEQFMDLAVKVVDDIDAMERKH